MMMNNILHELKKLYPDPKCMLDYNKDYELVISVMLSCRSTDKTVNKVAKTLYKYKLSDIYNMDIDKLENIIKPVGTQYKKASNIKIISKNILDKGYVPNDRAFLESLPGIGRKCANVILSELYNEDLIAVDTHVSRTSKRLGIAEETDSPLEIEKKLMKTFPKGEYSKLHLRLVTFGRNICKAKNPLCNKCPFYPCKLKK